MASAQAMEEELQQSVLRAENEHWDPPDGTGDVPMDDNAPQTSTVSDDTTNRRKDDGNAEDNATDMPSDHDASRQEDASDDEDNEIDQQFEGVEEEEAEDVDDDGEKPGAVKHAPGHSEDEDEVEDESEVSDLQSLADDESDEEAAWEDARDTAEDEEDSEAAPSNNCVFCTQDEENDPSEDFEVYLSCTGCGDNAHQQCARDAVAMSESNNAKSWKCPSCYEEKSEGDDNEDEDEMVSVKDEAEQADQGEASPLQEQDGSALDSGSDEGNGDSTATARLRRKRGSPSTELDDHGVALRKRRRNTSADVNSLDGPNDAEPADAIGSRSSRASRLKISKPPPVLIEKRSRTSLLLKLQVRPGNLKEILSRKKRDRRDRRRAAASTPRPPRPPAPTARQSVAPPPMIETPFTVDSYSQPFYSFFDKETDGAKGKPYGGILNEAEADTSKTLPATEDRRRFDQAKQKADDEWRARVMAMQAEAEVPLRRTKKAGDHASQIECIEFGGWEIDTWYAAPYPAEYSRNRVLYICEFCLKYMNSDYVAWRHKLKCATKHPPGDEIYRHGSVSVFEVDGRKNPVYCQNLCLLAKLFLGSKTLYYDVEPFLFYVLCEYNECGYHFVGYFSKEKRSSSQNNVSCILTLPIHQRKGYGNLLIDFSYLLTKVEQKTGSPEKPLSDMGLVSYRNYWRLILCRYFLATMKGKEWQENGLSVKRISDDTGMTADDVISALEGLRALVRDPHTKLYAFRVDLEFCRQYVAKWESKGYVQLKPEALAWTPYVMGRGNAANYEFGPINTIAPREDDEAKVEEGAKTLAKETLAEINGVAPPVPKNLQHVDEETKDEPNDDLALENTKAKGDTPEEDKENSTPQEDEGDSEAENEDESQGSASNQEDWREAYRDIPPSRFEVFPSINGSRRNDKARGSFSRPSVPRTVSSSSRPKRSQGSSSGRPKSSGSRKRTGGTGRGPGRFPKGTKKADYGNAASGPGLPPGWTPKSGLGNGEGKSLEELQGMVGAPSLLDIQLFAPKVETNGDGADQRESSLSEVEANADETMVDGEDVDASGEEA